ncbi:APOC3 protein, partial [Piaya cayana]|nr:APOC3 protein [Piaya cayana]
TGAPPAPCLVPTRFLLAGADSPREPESLVKKMQELAQKASSMAKSALSIVRESEVAQKTRQWLASNTELAKQRLEWMKEKLVELWKQAQAA